MDSSQDPEGPINVIALVQPKDNDHSTASPSLPPLPTRLSSRRMLTDESSTTMGDSVPVAAGGQLQVSSALVAMKDISDLSGSYLNGTMLTVSRHTAETAATTHYVSDPSMSVSSYQKPWAQATILSSRQPLHPQPPADCHDSVVLVRKMQTQVYQEEDAVIETVLSSSSREEVATIDTLSLVHQRTPIIILLMDPTRRVYELMQLWIDMQVDSVRDVVQAIRQHLADKADWKTDYDGLFQIRNNALTELDYAVGMGKLDPQPYEVFVAKPWNLSTTASQLHAEELLQFLQAIEVLTPSSSEASTSSLPSPTGSPDDDSVMVRLSKEARARVYVPSGILSHYHACQFLSFSPPFELPLLSFFCLDVLGSKLMNSRPGDDDSLLTESICEVPEEDLDDMMQLQVSPSEEEPMAEPAILGMRPAIFYPAFPVDDSAQRSDVTLTIKSIKRRKRQWRFSAWACCRSRSQLQFVVDGGRLPTESDCTTTPMEDSAGNNSYEDDASTTDTSYVSASLPLMFGRSTQTTQWTRLVIEP